MPGKANEDGYDAFWIVVMMDGEQTDGDRHEGMDGLHRLRSCRPLKKVISKAKKKSLLFLWF